MNIFTDKNFFILQKLIGNSTFFISPTLRGSLYKRFFKSVGKNFKVHENTIIKRPSFISIGDNIMFNQFCYITGADGLSIGDNVMIGPGVKITTSSHSFEFTDIPMIEQEIVNKSIIIENDVWIGFNSVILGGVKVEKGSIIGASSLVNKNIQGYSIFGGVPAKFIKRRTNLIKNTEEMDLK